MSALSLMTVSKEPHPDMLASELTITRGAVYRWYTVTFANIHLGMVEKVLNAFPMGKEDWDRPISGALVDDSGVEHPGTVMVSTAALKALREIQAAF